MAQAVLTRFGKGSATKAAPEPTSHIDGGPPFQSSYAETRATQAPSGPPATPARPFRKTGRWRSEPATKPQIDLIRRMLAARSSGAVEAIRAALNEAMSAGALTKGLASDTIDALEEIPTAPQGAVPSSTRPNKRAQRCEECRAMVEAEGGILTKTDDGTWEVRHRDGECHVTEFPFPYGRYAIEVDGVMKFYVADVDGLFAQASDDLHPVTTGAPEVIEAIAADPKAAAVRYGQELGVCGRCGRTLTSEWRLTGLGPICSKKGWA